MKPLPISFSSAQVASITAGRFGGRKKQVRALLDLVLTQWKQKNLTDALETAEAVRELLNGDGARPSREKARCLELLGGITDDAGDTPLAHQYLMEALEVEREVRPPDWLRIAELGRKAGAICQELGNLEEARRCFEDAVSDAKQGLKPHHVVVGDCLSDLGFFLHQVGENEPALPCLERAVEIHRNERGESSSDVARDYQGLAVALQGLGRYEESVGYYQKALYLRERQLGGDGTEMASLMVNMAEIYSEWGRHSSAMELLQQAIGRLECTGDERLGQALQKLGAVYVRCGRYEDAASCYTRARDIFQQTPGDHSTELENNAALMDGIPPHLRPDESQMGWAHSACSSAPPCAAPASGPAAVSPPLLPAAAPPASVPAAWNVPVPPTSPPMAWNPPATASIVGIPGGIPVVIEPDRLGVPAGTLRLSLVVPEPARPTELNPPASDPGDRLEGWEELAFDLIASV